MSKEFTDILFSDMCCSQCKADFTHDSIFILREEKNLKVIQVVCQNCGKTFGVALLGECDIKESTKYSSSDIALQIQEGPDAICYDDVIDAHNFFSKLDDDWQKYIPDELKK